MPLTLAALVNESPPPEELALFFHLLNTKTLLTDGVDQ